uniref:KRAB domain-containing protein n=1 Tax=Oryctolagus cuniculus TaxID=9986 RepID=A0A5F9D6J9_RABIT
MDVMSFEDVAMDFTREEWQFLNPYQRDLYKEVMLANYSNLVAVGEDITATPGSHHSIGLCSCLVCMESYRIGLSAAGLFYSV